MNDTTESVQTIMLVGKSGNYYTGHIFADKDDSYFFTGKAIALLSNSTQIDAGWAHRVNAIYNTDDPQKELAHFKDRDDISHLILLFYHENNNDVTDKVDDLIRQYLHG